LHNFRCLETPMFSTRSRETADKRHIFIRGVAFNSEICLHMKLVAFSPSKYQTTVLHLKRTKGYRESTEVCSCDLFLKNYIVLVPTYLRYQLKLMKGTYTVLIVWYLNMSSIDLATRFKIAIYLSNREKHWTAFPSSTYIIQVSNELPTR